MGSHPEIASPEAVFRLPQKSARLDALITPHIVILEADRPKDLIRYSKNLILAIFSRDRDHHAAVGSRFQAAGIRGHRDRARLFRALREGL